MFIPPPYMAVACTELSITITHWTISWRGSPSYSEPLCCDFSNHIWEEKLKASHVINNNISKVRVSLVMRGWVIGWPHEKKRGTGHGCLFSSSGLHLLETSWLLTRLQLIRPDLSCSYGHHTNILLFNFEIQSPETDYRAMMNIQTELLSMQGTWWLCG